MYKMWFNQCNIKHLQFTMYRVPQILCHTPLSSGKPGTLELFTIYIILKLNSMPISYKNNISKTPHERLVAAVLVESISDAKIKLAWAEKMQKPRASSFLHYLYRERS